MLLSHQTNLKHELDDSHSLTFVCSNAERTVSRGPEYTIGAGTDANDEPGVQTRDGGRNWMRDNDGARGNGWATLKNIPEWPRGSQACAARRSYRRGSQRLGGVIAWRLAGILPRNNHA
jgi:hypothetical protein